MKAVKLSDSVKATRKLLHVELMKLFLRFNVVKFGSLAKTKAKAANPKSEM